MINFIDVMNFKVRKEFFMYKELVLLKSFIKLR